MGRWESHRIILQSFWKYAVLGVQWCPYFDLVSDIHFYRIHWSFNWNPMSSKGGGPPLFYSASRARLFSQTSNPSRKVPSRKVTPRKSPKNVWFSSIACLYVVRTHTEPKRTSCSNGREISSKQAETASTHLRTISMLPGASKLSENIPICWTAFITKFQCIWAPKTRLDSLFDSLSTLR